MQLIKNRKLLCLALCAALFITAPVLTAEEQIPRFYAGLNPLSLCQFFGNTGASIIGFAYAAGGETGIALYGGWNFKKANSLEVRLSTGPANHVMWETQFQTGYLWYPCEKFLKWNGGPSVGFMLRNSAFYNTLNSNWTYNHVPELIAGWRFPVKTIALDLRAGCNISSFTWSTIPHSKPAFSWIDFPYGCTFSLCTALMF